MKECIAVVLLVSVMLLAIWLIIHTGASATHTTVDTASEAVHHLAYVKDSRTGLCFAVMKFSGYETQGIAVSYVPCTPEVERALAVSQVP
jgi:hypothetical protein